MGERLGSFVMRVAKQTRRDEASEWQNCQASSRMRIPMPDRCANDYCCTVFSPLLVSIVLKALRSLCTNLSNDARVSFKLFSRIFWTSICDCVGAKSDAETSPAR